MEGNANGASAPYDTTTLSWWSAGGDVASSHRRTRGAIDAEKRRRSWCAGSTRLEELRSLAGSSPCLPHSYAPRGVRWFARWRGVFGASRTIAHLTETVIDFGFRIWSRSTETLARVGVVAISLAKQRGRSLTNGCTTRRSLARLERKVPRRAREPRRGDATAAGSRERATGGSFPFPESPPRAVVPVSARSEVDQRYWYCGPPPPSGVTQLMIWYGSMMSHVLQCTQLLALIFNRNSPCAFGSIS
jgi:hypothetical protein